MEINICPRWVLTKLGIVEDRQYHIALFVSALLVVPLLLLAMHIPHYCLIRKILGIPCPGCGVSHSILAILRLDPVRAWAENPAGIGVALVLSFQLLARPIAFMAPRVGDLVSQCSRHISNVALGGLLLVWISRVF
jgi:hypothetical protein